MGFPKPVKELWRRTLRDLGFPVAKMNDRDMLCDIAALSNSHSKKHRRAWEVVQKKKRN